MGTKILRAIFMGGTKLFCLKEFWMKSSTEIERKGNRHLEMMNHLTSMKIAWDNMVSLHIYSIIDKQRLLDGVLNHFADR